MEIGEFEKGAEQGAWGLCAADPANRSEFPPVLTGYATKLGASRPVSKRRLAHRVIDVDSTYRATLEHCRVFDFEELQMKGQSAINHNFMNGHEVLRFG